MTTKMKSLTNSPESTEHVKTALKEMEAKIRLKAKGVFEGSIGIGDLKKTNYRVFIKKKMT